MAKQDVTVELFYSGVWNDHTASALVRDPVGITRGRANESSQPAPATCNLTFSGWRFNPGNVSGDLHGLIGRNTPLRVTVGTSVRFAGEVASWTPRQSLGGPGTPPDRWVEVEAAGITRRLGQGQDPLTDPLHRYLTVGGGATNLVGYWPMTGAEPRTRQAVAGGDMRLAGESPSNLAQWTTGDLAAPWLPPATAVQGTIESIFSGIDARARLDSGEVLEVTFDAAFRLTTGNLENRASQRWRLGGTNAGEGEFLITLRSNNFDGLGGGSETDPQWRWESALGTLTDENAYTGIDSLAFPALADGAFHVVRVNTLLSPGTDQIAWSVYFDGEVVNSGTATSVPLDTLRVTELELATFTVKPDAVVWGPVAVWAGAPPDAAESLAAFRGHVGEHAGERVERLTFEEGITQVTTGDEADTVLLGPQHPDGLLAILREAAAADQGTLVDSRDSVGELDYRTGRDHYNQAAALALDYDNAEVAPPLDPKVVDDQGFRNDITVKRRDGGQARAVDQDSVDAVGRTTTSVTVNCLSDQAAADQAGWRLNVATAGGTRFPQVTVDLDATPALVATVDAVDTGDRVTVANLPPELTPNLASLLVLGYTETIASHRRKITFNCTPAEPYEVGVWAASAGAGTSRWGLSGATTSGAFQAGTDTALTLLSGSLPLTTDAASLPMDIEAAGVRLTVTAVAGATSPQTLTITQTPANGVEKTIPSGSPVSVVDTGRWAL